MKNSKRLVNGVLLFDKGKHVSSNHALQRVRRLYGAKKAGHTGILDPLATGLLPICFGEASKFAQYLLDADKSYVATLKLGEATSTGDAEGEVIGRKEVNIEFQDLQRAIAAYTGEISQVPPMYSALKYQGKPLYEYARSGVEVERKSRQVRVHEMQVLSMDATAIVIRVRCSKGTYIRTLAEDLAKHMGTLAHLTDLRRIETASFHIDQSYNMATLEAMSEDQRDSVLLACDVFLKHFVAVNLPEEDVLRLQQGLLLPTQEKYVTIEPLCIYDHRNVFIGLARYHADEGGLRALRLMSTQLVPDA